MSGNKYILTNAYISFEREKNGVSKPKQDIIEIAKSQGFKNVIEQEELYYNINNMIPSNALIKRLKRKFFGKKIEADAKKSNKTKLNEFFTNLSNDDTLLVQYPLMEDSKVLLESFMLNKGLKNSIIVIHDIDSLRDPSLIELKLQEIKFIKSFNHIIVHNQHMLDYLNLDQKSNKYKLEIFDYLIDSSEELLFKSEKTLNKIFFAGNLMKSIFLNDVTLIKSFDFYVYGPNEQKISFHDNLNYKGILNPEDVVKEGEKYSFGLVWDGEDIDSLSGSFGNYVKYNAPYKFSCNIASGIPIIASIESGIADFIKEKGVGLLVSSLRELDDLELSMEEYNTMKKNVLNLRAEIIKGDRMRNIIGTILLK